MIVYWFVCNIGRTQDTNISLFLMEAYCYRRAVRENLYSKFDEFLSGWTQFDSDHGVDFYAHTCCQSATFGPFFAFYCSLFVTNLF